MQQFENTFPKLSQAFKLAVATLNRHLEHCRFHHIAVRICYVPRGTGGTATSVDCPACFILFYLGFLPPLNIGQTAGGWKMASTREE